MNPFLHPRLGPLHLGKAAPSPLTRKSMAKAFKVHSFLAQLPPPPTELDNTGGRTDWGMMENDNLGDCTCAACGHLIQTWDGQTVPDSAILTEYEQACGYNPSDPSTDQGGIISNVLDYFRDTGVGQHRISAHAEVNITQLRVQQSIYAFGAVDLGIQLPTSAQNQVGQVWDFINDTPDAQGGWGGHSVAAVAYDASGVTCVTWGQLQRMSWRWFMWYTDECHAAISPDYTSGPVPVDDLVADLQAVGS
jgi:hypothetical protein